MFVFSYLLDIQYIDSKFTPMLNDKILEIFIKVDDFCNILEYEIAKHQLPKNTLILKPEIEKLVYVLLKSLRY